MLGDILNKVKEAQQPERFTQDFLKTVLGFPKASAMKFIGVAKSLGFLSSDGKPTERYARFRNETQSGRAMAEGIKQAYPELYARNEYVHKLNRKELGDLVVEVTGLEKNHVSVKRICSTFETLKKFASFDAAATPARAEKAPEPPTPPALPEDDNVELNLSYTINLVLPKSDDVAVFNAIFKSLREHLIRK